MYPKEKLHIVKKFLNSSYRFISNNRLYACNIAHMWHRPHPAAASEDPHGSREGEEFHPVTSACNFVTVSSSEEKPWIPTDELWICKNIHKVKIKQMNQS